MLAISFRQTARGLTVSLSITPMRESQRNELGSALVARLWSRVLVCLDVRRIARYSALCKWETATAAQVKAFHLHLPASLTEGVWL